MASGEFAPRRRVAERKLLHQPHGSQRKTVRETFLRAVAENKFRAAAAHIKQQQREQREFRVRRHALKRPLRLKRARNDFRLQSGRGLNRVEQFIRVHRIARGAGGDAVDVGGFFLASRSCKIRDGGGGLRDGRGLKLVRLVKFLAEPRLPALLVQGLHPASRDRKSTRL